MKFDEAIKIFRENKHYVMEIEDTGLGSLNEFIIITHSTTARCLRLSDILSNDWKIYLLKKEELFE